MREAIDLLAWINKTLIIFISDYETHFDFPKSFFLKAEFEYSQIRTTFYLLRFINIG